MLPRAEKIHLFKAIEELNAKNKNDFYLNMMRFLAGSSFMDEVKPQTLWEPEKVKTVLDLILKTESVQGDIVELGVFRAGGTILIAETLKRISSRRHIYGIDSFEGLPEASEKDADRNGNVMYGKGKFQKESSYDLALLSIKMCKVDMYITLLKGFFKDILPGLQINTKFSFVIIDPDQYSGTKNSLETFYDHVSPGGYVLIDDYSSCAAVGVKKAVDEFLEGKPEHLHNGGLTMAYFVKQ